MWCRQRKRKNNTRPASATAAARFHQFNRHAGFLAIYTRGRELALNEPFGAYDDQPWFATIKKMSQESQPVVSIENLFDRKRKTNLRVWKCISAVTNVLFLPKVVSGLDRVVCWGSSRTNTVAPLGWLPAQSNGFIRHTLIWWGVTGLSSAESTNDPSRSKASSNHSPDNTISKSIEIESGFFLRGRRNRKIVLLLFLFHDLVFMSERATPGPFSGR